MAVSRVTPALTRFVHVQTPGTYASTPVANLQWGGPRGGETRGVGGSTFWYGFTRAVLVQWVVGVLVRVKFGRFLDSVFKGGSAQSVGRVGP